MIMSFKSIMLRSLLQALTSVWTVTMIFIGLILILAGVIAVAGRMQPNASISGFDIS